MKVCFFLDRENAILPKIKLTAKFSCNKVVTAC